MSVVRDSMSRDLLILAPDQDVIQAMKRMLDQRVSGAPVVDARGNLVGLLTQRDCLSVAYQASYHGQVAGKVSEFMTTAVETVPANLSLVEMIERFYHSSHRRFPVMDGNQLVGMISRRDVLRAVVDLT